jgi:hypothetical protein
MKIRRTIISVPPPRPIKIRALPLADVASSLSGLARTGVSRVFAKLQDDATGFVTIDYRVTINSVSAADFSAWRMQVVQILGRDIEAKIEQHAEAATTSSSTGLAVDPSAYALAVFAFVMTGCHSSYDDRDLVRFSPNDHERNENFSRVMTSIHRLNSELRTYTGRLEVEASNRQKEVFIPTTYFDFQDDRVVAFTGPKHLVVGVGA